MAAVDRPGSGEAAANFVQCYIKYLEWCVCYYITRRMADAVLNKNKRRKKENLYIIMCFCVMWVCVMRLFSEEIELIMYVFVCRCIRCLSNVTVIIYFKQYTTDLSSRLSRRDMLYSFRYSKVHKRIRNLKFCCIKLLDATF